MTMNERRTEAPARLVSLDAFRGAVMLLMASSGLGLAALSEEFSDRPAWRFVGTQVEHSDWVGCTLWDLIQPSFMFMVGVALPFSIASRRARGEGFGAMLAHALARSLALVLLAVFLSSAWSERTNWVFTNVLAQVGLGYPLLFLLAFTKPRTQWLAAAGILFGYWLLFALAPVAGSGFDWGAVGVPNDWVHLTGFAAHWEKNVNPAAAFDLWFLNLFPREAPYRFNEGGYPTLNFVPSLATMILGMRAGALMRDDRPVAAKLRRLVLAGLGGVGLGLALQAAGVCPIVKRIWTPSWAIFSGGVVALLLAGFVAWIDWRGWKRGAFPLVVAGMNPIALYVMWQLMGGFARENLTRHLGPHLFESFGARYAPVLERAWILLMFWLILLAMYRRRIFVRL
jgi:predicted acyltransferase